jgi:chitin disaccharide deacetylase
MKYLIVSADDFGLTKTTNKGIAKAYKDGIVTCINFISAGEAFEHAVDLAQEMGLEEAGAHLTLTETKPLTEPSKIPTLVTSTNSFHKDHNAFFLRYISGLINMDQAYIELKSQMDILYTAGLRITNLSSHEHIHMIPVFLDMFIKLAKEYDVPAIRFPHKDRSFHTGLNNTFKRVVLSYFEKYMRKRLQVSAMVFPKHFRGFLDSGKVNEEEVLWMVGSLEEGSTEFVCHPGFLGPDVLDRYPFHKNCESELSALTSRRVKKLIKDSGMQLLTYGKFLSGVTGDKDD